MFPDIVRLEVLLEHLHDLIRQRMRRSKDNIRLLCLHIFCIDCEEFLVTSGIDILAPGKCHQTSHIRILCRNDITSRQTHEEQDLRMVFALILRLVLVIKILELRNKPVRLLFPVKNLPEFLDRTVHPLHALKIQESPVRSDIFILRLKVRLQRRRAQDPVRIQARHDLHIRTHRRTNCRHILVTIRERGDTA